MNSKTKETITIFVRFTREAFHCWPKAPLGREYLRNKHRHLFHIEAKMKVFHFDREIEFHDFKDICQDLWDEFEMVFGESFSCEIAASYLVEAIQERFYKRDIEVSVSEDGECGAIIKSKYNNRFTSHKIENKTNKYTGFIIIDQEKKNFIRRFFDSLSWR